MSGVYANNTDPLDLLADHSVVDIRMTGDMIHWTVAVKPWQCAKMVDSLRRVATAIEAEASTRTH